MATKKTNSDAPEVADPAAAPIPAKAVQKEATYTVNEFAAVAASVFDSKPDIVKAALRLAGKERATKSEAIDIVKKFREREVK